MKTSKKTNEPQRQSTRKKYVTIHYSDKKPTKKSSKTPSKKPTKKSIIIKSKKYDLDKKLIQSYRDKINKTLKTKLTKQRNNTIESAPNKSSNNWQEFIENFSENKHIYEKTIGSPNSVELYRISQIINIPIGFLRSLTSDFMSLFLNSSG